MPGPVSRIAPNPRRFTRKSPPSVIVPVAVAPGIEGGVSFIAVLLAVDLRRAQTSQCSRTFLERFHAIHVTDLRDDRIYGTDRDSPAARERRTQHIAYSRELGATRLAGSGLKGAAAATTIRTAAGKQTIHDGPFAESREQLAGYYLIDVPDLDAALAVRRKRCLRRPAQRKSVRCSFRNDERETRTGVREASGRIVAALASRFRDLDLAEDSFCRRLRACARSMVARGPPRDAAAWLYQTAYRCAVDTLRRRRTAHRFAPELQRESEQPMPDEWTPIPDERLRLIFVCCHPAVAPDARAALTLRLVCGLSTREIARAFLLSEPTLGQRLIRAKRKIARRRVVRSAGTARMALSGSMPVLSTIEIAYGRAHEDAAGSGPHFNYAAEMLEITRVLAELLPDEAEASAMAAIVRFAEARRPARVDAQGMMIPLADQDPASWIESLIAAARHYLDRAVSLQPRTPRVLQARIHAAWCARELLPSRRRGRRSWRRTTSS